MNQQKPNIRLLLMLSFYKDVTQDIKYQMCKAPKWCLRPWQKSKTM